MKRFPPTYRDWRRLCRRLTTAALRNCRGCEPTILAAHVASELRRRRWRPLPGAVDTAAEYDRS